MKFIQYFCVVNHLHVKFNLHVHAWFDMSRVVFSQFVLLVLLTLLSNERKCFKICLKIISFFYIVAFLVCLEYPIIYAIGDVKYRIHFYMLK